MPDTKQVNLLPFMPPAFGPGSWYRMGEDLIPVYRSVRWKPEEQYQPGEERIPLPTSEELDPDPVFRNPKKIVEIKLFADPIE